MACQTLRIGETVSGTKSADFAASARLTPRWRQYVRRTGFTAPDLVTVMALLRTFSGPLLLEDRTSGRWRNGQPRVLSGCPLGGVSE
jgi:hypothetical protein